MTDLRDRGERPGIAGLKPAAPVEAYDATKDPRTGRPPNPLEAQRLAEEHEKDRLESAVEDDGSTAGQAEGAGFAADDAEVDERSPVPEWQEPGRMASPKADEDELSAIDALVQEGVAREQAELLVGTHGTNWETLKAAAFARHHVEGNEPE